MPGYIKEAALYASCYVPKRHMCQGYYQSGCHVLAYKSKCPDLRLLAVCVCVRSNQYNVVDSVIYYGQHRVQGNASSRSLKCGRSLVTVLPVL